MSSRFRFRRPIGILPDGGGAKLACFSKRLARGWGNIHGRRVFALAHHHDDATWGASKHGHGHPGLRLAPLEPGLMVFFTGALGKGSAGNNEEQSDKEDEPTGRSFAVHS